MSHKCCIVPQCTNTSKSTPGKIFISVPKHQKKRAQWLKIVRRDVNDITVSSTNYCCEDHFNLPEDAENWIKYSLCGGGIILKKGVIPHFFDCQIDRNRASKSVKERGAYRKRRRNSILSAVQQEQELLTKPTTECIPIVSNGNQETVDIQSNTAVEEPSRTVGVQVNIRKTFRSKGTNTSIAYKNVAVSPIRINKCDGNTSPFKADSSKSNSKHCAAKKSLFHIEEEEYESVESQMDSSSTIVDSTFESTSSEDSYQSVADTEISQNLCLKSTIYLITKNPKLYVGVPEDSFCILNILSKKTNIPTENILLILKKIKCASSFSMLGAEFGMTERNAAKTFENCLPIVASHLKELIIWPSTKTIRDNLPIPFYARFRKVESIIDCFEIETEKPSDPKFQALTWSEYKKCNTLKYLISATPDGIINYVSRGYGGRVSDPVLFEDCGYLDILRPGIWIMADRGFKHIQKLIKEKGCVLVRPPSVMTSEKPTKYEVKISKQIASLRIHIERVIRRIREFSYLAPHACINKNLISVTDYVVVTACGLINMQNAIISGK